jgi:carbohydrate kinase (thermoresistant glucokinase family)
MVIVITGVTGTDRSGISRALATTLGWPLLEGDDLRPGGTVKNARRGQHSAEGTEDAWLDRLHGVMARTVGRREHLVVTCPALAEQQRHRLRGDLKSIRFVSLEADPTAFDAREQPPGLLTVDAAAPPAAIVDRVRDDCGV